MFPSGEEFPTRYASHHRANDYMPLLGWIVYILFMVAVAGVIVLVF